MRVIIAVDDSPYSEGVMDVLLKRTWSEDTAFKILTVVEPIRIEEMYKGWDEVVREALLKREQKALEACSHLRKRLEQALSTDNVHVEVRHGNPRQEIVQSAIDWMADKIIIGAHGKGISDRLVWGSVSRTVTTQAPCSVEIVRPRQISRKQSQAKANKEAVAAQA